VKNELNIAYKSQSTPTNAYRMSQRGSSLVIAIVIVMIVMVLGTSLMLGALTHLKLTKQQMIWSSDYYTLDSAGESHLYKIDENLALVEDFAKDYISQRIFKIKPDATYDYQVDYIKENPMTGAYTNESYNFLSIVDSEFQLPSEGIYLNGDPYGDTLQMYFYQKYREEVELAYNPLADSSDADSISTLEKKFTDEIFNELYFISAYQSIKKAYTTLVTLTYNDADAYNNTEHVYYPVFNIKRELSQRSTLSADGTENQLLDIALKVIDPLYEPIKEIQYKSFKVNPVWTNAITAGGSINLNQGTTKIYGSLYASAYDSSRQYNDTYGIKVNAGDHTVYGNLYSRGDVDISGTETTMHVEGSGAKYAMAYKSHMYEDSMGTITDLFLENASTNDVMNNNVSLVEPASFSDDINDLFWFYNRDVNGGNTYARNIHANEDTDTNTAKGITFDTINSWVYGDVIMEAHQLSDEKKSTIEIKQNAIGLMNESTLDEPNQSSTVYSNSFDEGGVLKINKAYVPGLAYYRFDKRDGETEDAPYYFETIESITANSSRLFSEIYDGNIGKATAPLTEYVYSAISDAGPVDIPFMLNPNLSTEYNSDAEIENMISRAKPGSAFVDETLDDLGTNPNSIANRIKDNVTTGIKLAHTETELGTTNLLLKPKIFATGLLVSHFKTDSAYSDIATAIVHRNTEMLTQYNIEKEALKSAYLKKVKSFGFKVDDNDSYKYIDDCVNTGAISSQYTPNSSTADSELVSYLTQPGKTITLDVNNKNVVIIYAPTAAGETLTLNITRDFEGIVYAKGNIVINYSGDRFMRGTIIATGNVTLNRTDATSALNVVYDEQVIAKLINLYTPLKKFFIPFEKGSSENYELERYRTGMFSGLERFKIIKWQEKMN